MKKKVLLTVIALGVFFISSCDTIQDTPDDIPRNLGFVQETLKADTAIAGLTAGSFSAEGGNGILFYSLVSGEGDEDNKFFAVEGAALKIRAETLDEYDYSFRVKVADGKGESVEDSFTLKVGPPDEQGNSGDPDDPGVPNVPGVPGGSGNSGGSEEGGSEEGGEGEEGGNTGGGGNSGGTVSKPGRATGIESLPGMQFIKLSWRAPARATSYEVHYGAANDFAAATKYEEEPTGTALTVRGLADGTVYYFWVVAKNSGGSAMESNPHKAIRTSDDIPDFLKARLTPGGRVERYYATNLGWPDGDYYVVQDRGEDYLADERYYFGYANLGYGSGTIKYVWKFANPPEDPAVGKNQDRKPVYDLLWDINRGVIIYEFTDKLGATKYQATYYADEHVEPKAHIADHYGTGCHAPEAVMGQASGYNGVDSSNNDVTTDALDVAIAAFTSIGGPGQSGGRYAYWFMMQIYYAYRDPSIYPYD